MSVSDAARRVRITRQGPIVASCVALLALALVVSGCGTASARLPQQSGGTYNSTVYHFSVTYTDGWKATRLPGGSTAIPLTLTITHAGAAQAEGAFVSTFTLAVIDTTSPDEATPVAQLEKQIAAHSALTPLTLSGQPAYQDTATHQQSPDGGLTVTHTDYYLLHGRYEYAITTEAVSNDHGADAALLAMVQSFTLLP